MKKAKVGILTTFRGCDSAYSLVTVVRTQLKMLIKAGYDPVLFVAVPFVQGEGVYSKQVTDIRHLKPDDVLGSLKESAQDINIMLAHDIMFLSQHEDWAKASMEYAKIRPELAWIHWQHSRGGGQIKHELPENSLVAYPNKHDFEHVAWVNKVSKDKVRYVPHTLDLDYLGWSGLAETIAEDTEHPFVDVACILPTRLDRQKQVEKAVRLMAGFKKAGRSISFILADAYATGDRFMRYKSDIMRVAEEQHIEDRVVILGENYKDVCEYATPKEVVKALYEMSNIFILPSNAETSSLVAMEASLAGNVLILNADFPPILHLYEKAITLPFGSIFEDTKYYRDIRTADGKITKVIDDQLFWDDQARDTVLPVLDSQLAITVKRQQLRERWPRRVFDQYIEPLIQESYKPTITLETAPVSKHNDVTAIITTLDNLPLLARQIQVLRQDGCGQIIVVNNGSKDGTKDFLESISGIRYVNRENFGAGPGRNAGLDLWNMKTPYTLMIDGGILPQLKSISAMKYFLERHPDVHVLSPEVESCFTTNESEATRYFPDRIEDDWTFQQSYLSSTAYALCKQKAWDGLRFSEEGPFGQPGWGVDDNEMMLRWIKAGVIHHDFTHKISGVMMYRRQGGSFQRLLDETGIYPTQYGSVYEQRNVKMNQDWHEFMAELGRRKMPSTSYVIADDIGMPDFAKLVKFLHENEPECEIVVRSVVFDSVKWWLDVFALRQYWGDCAVDEDGKILRRGKDVQEELWSGNVVRNREPLTEPVIISQDNLGEYLKEEEYA